ncbi:cytochrome P450 3A27-like [Alosa sapidissima]|uniref:cytochrome P450 3A27-like n=1 Tax=Alosa sapidissima TaxID=34773 RepID=UPI001C091386|nr:cytochrome P450 3A27-like [Alosa sapidissima]
MNMLPSFSMETWALLVLLLTLLIIYGTWPYGYFKNIGIPGPRPWPFLGSFGSMAMKGFHVFDQQCFQKYGRMWGIFEGRSPVLMVTDPGMIKAVMVKEFYTAFTNRRKDVLSGQLADALTAVEDEKWKRIRTSLSPTFTSGRIKEVFPIAGEYANRLIEYLKKQNLNEAISMKDMFGLYNMDVLTSTSFSVEADSINNPNDPLVANVKKLMNFSLFNPAFVMAMVCPSMVPLMDKLGISFFSKSLMDFFYSTLQKIKEQHGEDDRRVDFLQLMMRSQISNEEAEKSSEDQPVKGLTEHEILSQSFLFILAGYDTTSNTLGFLAYSIAINPDVLNKLIEEIDSVFPNNAPVTYEKLMHLEYLDMVICESQRMWPAAPRLERMCKQTVVINGVTIPKGTLVAVPVPILHHDPELWTSPEAFNPERFSKDNKESIDPYAYLPFGIGPRNCIGMRFALMLVKLIMVQLLQNFNLETCKETLIPMELDALFRPKKPIMLKLVPRSHLSTEE